MIVRGVENKKRVCRATWSVPDLYLVSEEHVTETRQVLSLERHSPKESTSSDRRWLYRERHLFQSNLLNFQEKAMRSLVSY